ncbi:MAG: Rpn family recombination-promoting nuclease/putative transposase, partial [Magnetococcales bacterium]|nr:Rpn family recombination-promoting nuclease/putative transposase [Magnetococcales bacterium]
MNEIAQPHDRLFKALMSHPETAGAFLQECLPPEVAKLLSPEPPQLVDGTFVEDHLRLYYSDRLFESKTITGKPLLLYTLVEHKSHEYEKVAWQLFQGIHAFMDQKTREDKNWRKLPAVLPLLLYHGAQEWRIPNELMFLVDADEALRPWLVNFYFPVVDLGPIPNGQLSQHARLRTGFMALKYGTRSPQEQMEALEELIDALLETPELLLTISIYLLTTFPRMTEEHVRLVVRRVKPQEEAEMMSQFAQEILAKGKPEWAALVRQEGEQKGKAETLTRQLQYRFGNLPSWAFEKVSNAKPAMLEEWSLRILDAP